MAGFISKLIQGSKDKDSPEPPPEIPEELPLPPPPKIEVPPVDVGAVCDIGSVRQVNQDRVLALIGEAAPAGAAGVFVVSDGMGGHAAGEVAAQMAVDGVRERMLALTGAQLTSSPDVMRTLIVGVNIDVHTASFEPGQQGMGATLTVCALAGSTLVIGHIGDSRAYVLRNGSLNQITPDHSWVMEMVARGLLTPEQAETHPRRNVLTRALGIERRADVHVGTEEMLEGDAVLICSDGLHGVVSAADIAKVMARENAQDACDTLAAMANRLGGPDNIGIVIARLNRLGADAEASVAASTIPSSAIPSAEEGAAVTMVPGVC